MRATTTVTTSSPPSWRITSAITPEPWARPDGGQVRNAHGRSCEPGSHRARGAMRLPERGAGFDPPVPRRSPAGPHYAQRLEAVRHLAEQRPPVAGGAWFSGPDRRRRTVHGLLRAAATGQRRGISGRAGGRAPRRIPSGLRGGRPRATTRPPSIEPSSAIRRRTGKDWMEKVLGFSAKIIKRPRRSPQALGKGARRSRATALSEGFHTAGCVDTDLPVGQCNYARSDKSVSESACLHHAMWVDHTETCCRFAASRNTPWRSISVEGRCLRVALHHAISLMPALLPRGDGFRMNSWRAFLEIRLKAKFPGIARLRHS